jgi:hypothetical protein
MRERNPIAAAGDGGPSEVLAAYFKSFRADLRSLSFPCLRIVVGLGGMLGATMDRQLLDSVFHRSLGRAFNVAFDPNAESEARASGD